MLFGKKKEEDTKEGSAVYLGGNSFWGRKKPKHSVPKRDNKGRSVSSDRKR